MATLSNDYSQLPYLSPTQQGLLLAALSSNKRSTPDPASSSSQSLTGPQKSLQSTTASKHQQAVTETIDPTMFNSSLSGSVNVRNSLNATSYPGFVTDLDFGFADNGNDFTDDFGDFANDFDADGEVGEKRKNSDASDEEELGNKRREGGDDKTTKKAGRKPLTSEPTTKRKAQNRAAQRAFRERKEKHLKDLEQKVVDLEKHSESANHENGVLRAQVDRLQTELQEYRKRLSSQSNGLSTSPPSGGFASYATQSSGGLNNFNFDFPRFGTVSDAQYAAPATAIAATSATEIPASAQSRSSSDESSAPPSTDRDHSAGTSPRTSVSSGHTSNEHQKASTASMIPTNGMFDPEFLSLFESGDDAFGLDGFYKTLSPTNLMTNNKVTANSGGNTNRSIKSNSRSTADSRSSHSASPPESSSNNRETSSCATSPESFKGYDTANASTSAKTSSQDIASIDWLAAQNNGQFDPVLFGDYRDSQDAIIGGAGDFSSGFFDDSFANFNTTFPSFNDAQTQPSVAALATTILPQETACSKLMKQVNQCAAGLTSDSRQLIVPGEEQKSMNSAEEEENKYLTAHKIWSTLQTCPKFQSGDLDIEGLCTQLSSKAKCSEYGHGLVVPKDEVEAALWRLAGVDDAEAAAGVNR